MRNTNLKHLLFSVIIMLCFSQNVFSQGKNTISGYVKDADNGETLIGVSVYVDKLKNGVVTNPYGFFSISLPADVYKITFSYVGFNSVTKEIDLSNESQKVDITLSALNQQLEEVVVTGEREDANVTNIEMSVQKLGIQTIKKMPALLGEVDIIKSIQLLPGVSTVGEGASGFNVRGGGVGQNLVLLDEAPVFNTSHLFGFFSVFNPDAVKDVKLIKGGIPAQYGGRLSSILDVRMKEGNINRFEGQGGIGALFSRLTLEAPIVKDKASFIVAGRRSYADVLAGPFLSEDLEGSKFNFYDLTAKANWRINDKNTLFVSGYLGADVFNASGLFGFDWGNTTASLRWNHLFSEKLFSNVTAFYSKYDYKLNFGDAGDDSFNWEAQIETYNVKPEFTYYLNSKNTITFGGQSTLYKFRPGKITASTEGDVIASELEALQGWENALYIGNEQNIGDRVTLKYGIRASSFTQLGSTTTFEYGEPEIPGYSRPFILSSAKTYGDWEPITTYWNLEPRFGMKVQLNNVSSIKASYNRMAQYVHLISNTTASSPLDVWHPSSKNVKPQIADQVAIGYFRNFKNNTYEFSIETYYKDISQMVDYAADANLLLNPFLEGDIIDAKGRAYGAEFLVRKNKGKLNGWASYTLARSEIKAENINNNEWYPARFDQTHNLKVVAFYDFNKKWSISSNFTYVSGTPATFPTNTYSVQGYFVPHNDGDVRNNSRIPDYHRLDLSVTLTPQKERKWKNYESYWVFSLYNVYGKKNPFSIYFNPNSDRVAYGQASNQATRLSVIGTIIPSVSYNFKF